MIGIFQGRGIGDSTIFAQIDVEFRKHIKEFNDNGSMTSLAVFLNLALHADSGGWVKMSRVQLQKEIGITTENAITKALKHLRKVKIGGHRIFAHYREKLENGQWGKSAYLIFPDLDHPEPPFENMLEFDPESSDEQVAATLRDSISGNSTDGTSVTISKTISKENQLNTREPAKDAGAHKGPNKSAARKEIEDFFVAKTCLPGPKTANHAERRAAGTLWWNPLRNILEATDWNVNAAKYFVNAVVNEMRDSGLTIASPKSVENMCISKIAEYKSTNQSHEQKQRSFVKTHI